MGDAISSRPVTISSAGSDFNTVLAVYEGAALGQLITRAENNDRSPLERESQVTFIPTPGSTYFIALDGSTNSLGRRYRFGNYQLRLDYSVALKSQMVLKAKNVISKRRIEWDAGWIDLSQAFMAIRPQRKGRQRSRCHYGGSRWPLKGTTIRIRQAPRCAQPTSNSCLRR